MSYYTETQLLDFIMLAKDMKLEGRSIIEEYAREELLEISNGIGADWMNPRTRERISASLPTLEPVAFIHDIRYFKGGNEADREYADEEFLRNGRAAAAWQYPWWHYRRYAVRAAAKICYRALQLGGREAWNYTEADSK